MFNYRKMAEFFYIYFMLYLFMIQIPKFFVTKIKVHGYKDSGKILII